MILKDGTVVVENGLQEKRQLAMSGELRALSTTAIRARNSQASSAGIYQRSVKWSGRLLSPAGLLPSCHQRRLGLNFTFTTLRSIDTNNVSAECA